MIGTVDTNATLSLPINQTEVIQDQHGNWIAPLVPMYPMSNGNVRIQLKAEVAGQPDTYKLADFSVFPTSTNLTYDANGSLVGPVPSPGGTNLILNWNSEGRLASTTDGSTTNTYFYDTAGRRITKIENGSLVLYLWDGWNNAATANGSAQITAYYSRGADLGGSLQGAGGIGGLIAATRMGSTNDHADGISSGTYLLHSNHRGDIISVSDFSGSWVAEYQYTPFGNPLSESGTFSSRYRFSSKELDVSGLYYYGYRYYAPQLCRWISPDPIAEVGDFNLYRFCENDPVNFVDSLGNESRPITEKVEEFMNWLKTVLGAANPSSKPGLCDVSTIADGIFLGSDILLTIAFADQRRYEEAVPVFGEGPSNPFYGQPRFDGTNWWIRGEKK
jgi:RHS repeat-associated protein